MPNATELLRRGRREEVWVKYCGFLDLGLDEFMAIQQRLLLEQISLLSHCEIGRRFMGARLPASVEEFRRQVPITTYEDYQPHLEEQREDALPEKAYLWAHTSGRSGTLKWMPYTRQAYERLGECVLAGVILGAARRKGDMRLEENDVLVANTPPRPYLSGVVLRALAEHFAFRFVPPLDETEQMTFQDRIEKGFATALVTGIDVLGSISVVLVKMGERFAEGARTLRISTQMLHPKAALRLARGWLRSKLEGRPMLPRDLWKVKALQCGGMDTSIYKDRIAYYWGVNPFEQYGATEGGIMATQTWNMKGMSFFPDADFYEFIPEEEWYRSRNDPNYRPQTVLLNEVQAGKRYEVVVTNLNGNPLLRYRMHDVITFTALRDAETGVNLPQMQFVGRSGDFIDLSGFTGLIDEKMVWQAVVNTGIRHEEWAMRKEYAQGRPILRLYIEPTDQVDAATIRVKVNERLCELNPFYADYQSMIEASALEVTIFRPGTFQAYMLEKQSAGADLAHLKPPHMNASDEELKLLLRLSERA